MDKSLITFTLRRDQDIYFDEQVVSSVGAVDCTPFVLTQAEDLD